MRETNLPTTLNPNKHGMSNLTKAAIAMGIILGVAFLSALIGYIIKRIRNNELRTNSLNQQNSGNSNDNNNSAFLGIIIPHPLLSYNITFFQYNSEPQPEEESEAQPEEDSEHHQEEVLSIATGEGAPSPDSPRLEI